MNNKIVFSFIIFCCSNALMSMENRKPDTNQLQTWYQFKEINIAEKIIGIPNKDILRKSEEYYITSVCIDPSEKSLAIASCDKKVRILDINSEKMLEPIDCFKDDITSMCFNHSGNKLAVTSYKPATHFFNIERDVNKKIISYNHRYSVDHNQEISSICFDSTNNAVGVILDEVNQEMNIINITQNSIISSFKHNSWIKTGSISQSKYLFATGSNTDQARLFAMQKNNLHKNEPICIFKNLQGSVTALAFDKHETLLAVASNKPKLHIFDLKTYQEVASFDHKKYISTICLSASGKMLAFGSFDGKVYLFKKR